MTIIYSDTKVGDILKIVNAGAPGFALLGDLVRVKEVYKSAVLVEDKHGDTVEFVFNCGAARLEITEWKKDFPWREDAKLQQQEDEHILRMDPDGDAS